MRSCNLPHLKGNTFPVIGIIFVELLRKDHHGDLLTKTQKQTTTPNTFHTLVLLHKLLKEQIMALIHNLIICLFCSGNITCQSLTGRPSLHSQLLLFGFRRFSPTQKKRLSL